jgi:ferritin
MKNVLDILRSEKKRTEKINEIIELAGNNSNNVFQFMDSLIKDNTITRSQLISYNDLLSSAMEKIDNTPMNSYIEDDYLIKISSLNFVGNHNENITTSPLLGKLLSL